MEDLFSISGEALPARVFSVSEITRVVRGVIESTFDEVCVEGEVSNYRRQASGHQYFTLKDSGAQMACVQFARGRAAKNGVAIQDGLQVQAKGRLTVYEARGQYQLTVTSIHAAGAGLLQAKFEALKRKLAAEGLFDSERKRALPKFPRAVGIVTSPTGAALRDMLHILARRAPWLRVIVSPTRVQGAGAAAEILAAMEDFRRIAAPVDVVVLARGGGSIEDLWEFNEETLARAIAAFPLPVVSAIGHEIDFTIADFAADLRAPTPSAAAELVAPDVGEISAQLAQVLASLRREAMNALESARVQLAGLARSAFFREPEVRIQQCSQRLDSLEQAMRQTAKWRIADLRNAFKQACAALQPLHPERRLALLGERFSNLERSLAERFARGFQTHRTRLMQLQDLLRLLSPKNTLARGYSLTTDRSGRMLSSAADALLAGEIMTEFHDGKIRSTVLQETIPGRGKSEC